MARQRWRRLPAPDASCPATPSSLTSLFLRRIPVSFVKREIVINASALEVRVALLEDGSLAELYLERQQHRGLAGNIYKGKVTRVLPGMQAAFVDIGLEKAGFLHVSDFQDGISAMSNVAEVIGEEDVETEPVGDNEFADVEMQPADEGASDEAAANGEGSPPPQQRGRRRGRSRRQQ